jgi:hypothetical protein
MWLVGSSMTSTLVRIISLPNSMAALADGTRTISEAHRRKKQSSQRCAHDLFVVARLHPARHPVEQVHFSSKSAV